MPPKGWKKKPKEFRITTAKRTPTQRAQAKAYSHRHSTRRPPTMAINVARVVEQTAPRSSWWTEARDRADFERRRAAEEERMRDSSFGQSPNRNIL